MKITPKKYAAALVSLLEESKEPGATIRTFLSTLRRRGDFKLLPKIVMAFEKEWSDLKGILNISVIYPKKFESGLAQLESALAAKSGKIIRMKAKSSDTIIGGYRIKMEDTLIDASLEGKLDAFTSRL